MTNKDIKKLAPGLGNKVKVTNKKYINNGYIGTISSLSNDGFILVIHPFGSDAWEKIENCELLKND